VTVFCECTFSQEEEEEEEEEEEDDDLRVLREAEARAAGGAERARTFGEALAAGSEQRPAAAARAEGAGSPRGVEQHRRVLREMSQVASLAPPPRAP
jgi:hypothetical protein